MAISLLLHLDKQTTINTGRKCNKRLEASARNRNKIEQPNQLFEFLQAKPQKEEERTTMATKPLHVTVVSAHNLPAGNHVDPYCCVALQPGPREHHFSHRHCHTKTRPITKVRRFEIIAASLSLSLSLSFRFLRTNSPSAPG